VFFLDELFSFSSEDRARNLVVNYEVFSSDLVSNPEMV
jgi:hypothetical protein